MTGDKLLSAATMRAALGGICSMTLWRWVDRGTLPKPIVINRRNYWPESAVQDVIERGRNAKAAEPEGLAIKATRVCPDCGQPWPEDD